MTGGGDLGLERAGCEIRWQIEKDTFSKKILERHWPGVKRYDDITTVDAGELDRVDLLVGGFPCQDLSVAGKRAGLAGERSSLFWEFARLAGVLRPAYLLIENVPGLFSSRSGRDFGQILNALDELGYGVAWRVLDSQAFGVPQRRRRVFIVGCLGRPCPPEILFEPESSDRHTPEGGKAGQGAAHKLKRRFDSNSRVSHPLLAKANNSFDDSLETYIAAPIEEWQQNGGAMSALAVQENQRAEFTLSESIALNTGGGKPGQGYPAVLSSSTDTDRVRTPSGFSRRLDSGEPDGPRYRVLGNAMTVNVVEWIGRRIMKVATG